TINFSGVTYRFQDKNGGQERAVAALPSAVAGITLTLAAGTRTALVGRSGAGKSTLVNLLLRFLDPDAGIITVSGVDLRELALDRWRARVALVPQQPHMFAGTIADNLLLARPEATQADLAWATEQAGASEFIARLPGGYATPVGEQGVLLSAGEVQRLAIARAFLKAAPVLILDEPTSALDPEHEAQVRHSLDRLMAGRTVLIVAHRRNTIVGADQIAALDGGRLVESGRYQELLERGGPDPKPPSLGRKGATTTGTTKVGGRILPSHTEEGATRAALASEPWLTGGKKGLAGCAAPVACAPFPGREGGWGLGRLLALLGPHRGSVALALLLGVLTGIAGVGLLATGGYLVAAAALGTPILALGAPIALVRLFGVGRGLTRYAERLSAHRVTFALLTTLRVWCYHRLLPLTPARLGAFRSGDLLTRLVKDVAEMEAIYLRVGAPVVVALILSLLIVLLFAQFSLILAVVMAAYLVLAGVGVPWLVYRLSRTAQAQVVAGRAAMQAQVIDVLQGMADLLALGREFARDGAFNSLQQGLIASRQRLAQVVGLQRLLATFVAGGALWTVLILAIQLIDQQALQARYLPLLALVALVSFETVQPLGEAFTAYRGTTAAAERVYALIEAAPAVADPPRPRPAPTSFAIRFDRVSFAYQLAGPAALREVSFCLPAGSHVAIVGPSGSGKTTLVNLLVRFWDPDTGTIQLGGHDLRAYALNDLRRSIGVVSQRTTIFNATLRRNLLLARPEASDDELLRALERARLGDLVAQSPYGLDRWVGEQGVQLSGGERQRLAIARTLLLDAPVLVLDEPTANLDPVTEGELLAELAAAMAGRTTVTITHRLIGLEHMDEILVLDAGRIVERGTHGQLLERYGLYRRMLDAQEQFVEET
ncbi:MAG: thiol reductant ABC exporter subunit CydC, partial [Chloroflexota bacterium]